MHIAGFVAPGDPVDAAGLHEAINNNPGDARAPYHLGNLLYERGRREEAIGWWEKAARLERGFPLAWRNLGIGYYNVLHDVVAAKGAYQRALQNVLTWAGGGQSDWPHTVAGETRRPGDMERGYWGAQILYERDQIWKLSRELPQTRLEELERYRELVGQHRDLRLEYAALLNQLERAQEALEVLEPMFADGGLAGVERSLVPWTRAHVILGRKKLWLAPGSGGSAAEALAHFTAALNPPPPSGDPAQPTSELHYWAGVAARSCERRGSPGGLGSVAHFRQAVAGGGLKGGSLHQADADYWAGLALHELGRQGEARAHFEAMLAYAEELKGTRDPAAALAAGVFELDAQLLQLQEARLWEALGSHGLAGAGGAGKKSARRLLNDILAENPSHGLAADLMVALDWA